MARAPRTPSKNKPRKPRRKASAVVAPAIDPRHHPDSAGIDVGAEEFVAALPPGRCKDSVRTFRTFTSGIEELRDWFLLHGIKTAAMESTGNYWICLYDALVRAGIEVCLVNARHVKGVPGRKTDVCDAQWLQQLHAAGLLRKSHRPEAGIVPVRFLMRHRSELVADASKQLRLMQKSLTEMNLKLHHVFSDIDGVSAQAIIEAILAGERDADKLAALRDRRSRSSTQEVKEALRGDYRPEYLFVLRQSQGIWRSLCEKIAECDAELGRLLGQVSTPVESPLPRPRQAAQHRLTKNNPQCGIFEQAWRFYGVDLSDVPGAGAGVLAALMSEVGTREHLMKAFRSGEALCSWLGLCPDNRISGGKVLKAKTRKVQCRLAQALRLGVHGLQRSQTRMGEYVRRMKGRLGKAEGLTAGAHKLGRVLYAMIRTQSAYNENEAFKTTPQKAARRLKNLQQQAASLGFQLQPLPQAA